MNIKFYFFMVTSFAGPSICCKKNAKTGKKLQRSPYCNEICKVGEVQNIRVEVKAEVKPTILFHKVHLGQHVDLWKLHCKFCAVWGYTADRGKPFHSQNLNGAAQHTVRHWQGDKQDKQMKRRSLKKATLETGEKTSVGAKVWACYLLATGKMMYQLR